MNEYKIPSTQKEFDYIINGFLDKSLPAQAWTHEAHLIVGLWHVSQFDRVAALAAMRENIRSYNVATGGQNTDTSGYHETITVYWVWLLGEFWDKHFDTSFEKTANLFLKSKYVDRNSALKFYTKEVLFSKEARLTAVDPDMISLDFFLI